VDLELTAEQQELRAVAAQALARLAPLSLARAFLDGGGDASPLWESLRGLGWFGIGAQPDDPFGVCGLCLLAEQHGRQAAPTTLVDSAACARAAVRSGEGPQDVIGGLGSGELTCALAVLEAAGRWDPSELDAVATPTTDGYAVSGAKLGVHHAASVDLIGVVALLDGSPGLFLVKPSETGVEVVARAGLDPAGAPSDVTLRDAAATVSVSDAAHVREALTIAGLATGAEGVGAASAALDIAIAYARERVQYGRPIARFQAVQHLLAELHVQRETAWSSILFAAATIDERGEALEETAAIAQAHAARCARTVTEGALQVLGGIGFTWEHDHHLLHRRALECEQSFGDALHHERLLGALLARRAAAGAGHRPAPVTAG
jgi:alkylation response protein AidB-like acyl-CoA dehydrogenase